MQFNFADDKGVPVWIDAVLTMILNPQLCHDKKIIIRIFRLMVTQRFKMDII